jgi:hypothetical protein
MEERREIDQRDRNRGDAVSCFCVSPFVLGRCFARHWQCGHLPGQSKQKSQTERHRAFAVKDFPNGG